VCSDGAHYRDSASRQSRVEEVWRETRIERLEELPGIRYRHPPHPQVLHNAPSAPLHRSDTRSHDGTTRVRVGIVSDIHCNGAGLIQALHLMGDIDELICLGDSIYEYRFSNEVVQILKDRAAQVIAGNHEECFFGPHGVRARARDGIDPELAAWLAGRPHRMELAVGGKRLLLVHSTPWEPRGTYVHPGDALLARFAEAEADFVLYGHTHAQVVRRIGRVLVINPGSTGDPRDHRNGGQLSCAVLDTASEEVQVLDFPDPRRA
jgi:putative phosphoesterase